MVHLGIGAFFRAFGVPWIEQAGVWGVIGVSLRSATTRDALRDQGYCYTALEMGHRGRKPQQIEALRDILVAPENPTAVLERMGDPATQIVSMTVTEKGYCHDPATGALNRDHPDIAHDIAHDLPVSAPGFIVRALQMRRRAGTAGFTVMSCDNLPDNGALVRGVVIDLAQKIDPELADWIRTDVAFPSTMVDRIVPATTQQDIEMTQAMTGRIDAAPVLHEPFRQWVIEDHFSGDRPELDRVGVQIVADVAPFEHMKLRMLNGAHSAIAYLGYLAGHKTVADAMADPVISAFITTLWQEQIIPTLTPPEGIDLQSYAQALAERFRNPALKHSTWQIAMDGSQKLPQRILGTLSDVLDQGKSADPVLLVVAGWMKYVGGTDERGAPIDVSDPLADQLGKMAGTDDPVASLLSMHQVFSQDLAARIREPLTEIYADLSTQGAREMAQRMAR